MLTDIDLSAIVEFHEKKQALATIALCPVENPLEFGIVITREDGSIERFLEKPGWGQVFSDTINTGIYVLEPEIFEQIPEGRAVDFSGEVFPAVLEAGDPLFGYVASGYWEDVGTTAAYLKAHEDILDGRVDVGVSGFELRPGVWVGKGTSIHPSVRIDGPAFVGENCTVDADAVLGAYATVGANTRVGERAEVERSVVGENSYLGTSVSVQGAVLGRSLRPPQRGALRTRLRARRGLPDRRQRGDPHRGEDLPGQGGRGRRTGQRFHRLGVRRGAHAVRTRGRAGDRQRGRQPRDGRPLGQGLGVEFREGFVHHGLT